MLYISMQPGVNLPHSTTTSKNKYDPELKYLP